MLVLGRKCGERVVLRMPDGREVVVTLAETARGADGKGKALLGFDAPADVVIYREELRWRFDGAGGPKEGE